MPRARNRSGSDLLRIAGLCLAAATLGWTFRDLEAERLAPLLARVGGAGVLILVPQLLSLLAESFGWHLAFESMGQRLPLLGLLRARLATEALAQTVPMGVVLCESLKPVLLARNCGVELATSLAGMAARKWLLVGSQSLYVLGFAVLGWPMLSGISQSVLRSAALPFALAGAAGLLLMVTAFSFVLFARGDVAVRAHRVVLRLPCRWLISRLAPLQARLTRTDRLLATFFASVVRSPWPLLAFLTAWLLEAADTYLILHLLGVQLPWTAVGALEVSASLLRNVVFMVPAGIGVQELSYLAFLRALHIVDALSVAAAFLLLKRCKELFWAACGYAILAHDLRSAPVRSLSMLTRLPNHDRSVVQPVASSNIIPG